MTLTIFNYLYFSLLVLALIAFVDVLVKFKKALDLKFFFLLLPFSIAAYAWINSVESMQFVFYVAFFKSCIGVSILNIFSILYFPKFRKWTLFTSVLLLTFTVFFLLLNKNILPSNSVLNHFKVKSVDDHLFIQINTVLRLVRFSFLFLVSAHMVFFWYVIYTKYQLNNIYYVKIKQWTNLIFLSTVLIILGNIAIGFTENRSFWVNILALFVGFSNILLVLKRPNFLNTAAKKIAFGHKFNLDQEAEIDEIVFLKYFLEQKYFTNKEASLDGLANQLKVSSQHLSQFIQKKYAMSFSDLVNKNRVNYFFEIVQDPAYQNFTIDALAREVGFSSRQHLNKPFKKFHGGNPSDLIDATIAS